MDMHNFAIYFDNYIDYVPFALLRINGTIKVLRNFKELVLPSDVITLGYANCIDSMRRLGAKLVKNQKRVEILHLLSVQYSKGDQPKKWSQSKLDIIGRYLDKSVIKNLKKYEDGEIGWSEYSDEVFVNKVSFINALDKAYTDLLQRYINLNKFREKWIDIEFIIDNIFLENQFNGIVVDNNKIKDTLRTLNNEKYSALMYLEKYHGIDLASGYISDQRIDELTLTECNENEKNEELAELLQVVNVENKKIEAISKIKECRIDYANLIKHYSITDEQKVFPQYEIIGSSSGRIFISSPGTQYLKKTKRDIFIPNIGMKIAYFDFRNYEPGIAAGLSSDKKFIEYYNEGDMYSRIARECFNNESYRKQVKISLLSYLYGMSLESQKKLFSNNPDFDPGKVISVINSFSDFITWRNEILKEATNKKIVEDKSYTRVFTPENIWKIKTSALNHVIQSTGSRILKRCIYQISKYTDVRILIPMHDAILCELNCDKFDKLCIQISNEMEKIFTQEVINVTSKVVVTEMFK